MSVNVNIYDVIENLKCFADEEYQCTAWLAEKGPVVSSLMEDVSQLFDDTGLRIALEKNQVVFNQNVDTLLRVFRSQLLDINQHQRPEQLIRSQKMQQIRVSATAILKLLSALTAMDQQNADE